MNIIDSDFVEREFISRADAWLAAQPRGRVLTWEEWASELFPEFDEAQTRQFADECRKFLREVHGPTAVDDDRMFVVED